MAVVGLPLLMKVGKNYSSTGNYTYYIECKRQTREHRAVFLRQPYKVARTILRR